MTYSIIRIRRHSSTARNHNTFGAITNGPDNYQDLINAYITAGVAVSDTWAAYLGQLGRLVPQGPENIYTIAQARYDGLTAGVAMSTKKHEPKHGGHVVTGEQRSVGRINHDRFTFLLLPQSVTAKDGGSE